MTLASLPRRMRPLAALLALAALVSLVASAPGCSKGEAPGPSPAAASASAAVEAVDPASQVPIEEARGRGEYKARMALHIVDVDARIKDLDARAGAPGGEKLKPQVEAVREARWRLDRAQKAVQGSGDDEWKQATAEYEAADRDLSEKLDKALAPATPPAKR